MDKVGFIGYGSMGSMLVNGFLAAGILQPDQVVVSTRSQSKLTGLLERWPVEITDNNERVAEQSRTLFLCTKPLEVKDVLQRILPYLTSGTHLISIAASLTIGDLENLYHGKITKVIPSFTSEIGKGISLICHNELVKPEDAAYVEGLFASLSKPKIIAEENFEAAADLTSCAPGLIAAIFREFVEAGVRHSTLSEKEAAEMVMSTLYGTAKLMIERRTGFDETIARVATKGGITEEGVLVLKAKLPEVFNEVFSKTLGKHRIVKDLIKRQFSKD